MAFEKASTAAGAAGQSGVPGAALAGGVAVPSLGASQPILAAAMRTRTRASPTGPSSWLVDMSNKAAKFSAATGQYAAAGSFNPFGSSVVRPAAADVNGDGVADAVYAVGPGGGSLVRVVDGATGQDLAPATATFLAPSPGIRRGGSLEPTMTLSELGTSARPAWIGV